MIARIGTFGSAHGRTRLLGLAAVVLALGHAAPHAAAQEFDTRPENGITLVAGRSTVLTDPTGIVRVSISDPEIAEVVVVSSRELLLNARKPGITTLVLWNGSGRRRMYQLEVTPDVDLVQRQLQALFPRERIRVSTSGGALLLSGEVSDTAVPARARALVEATGAAVVDNLVRLGPQRQVLLQVRIAEVNRSEVEQFGTELRAVRLNRPDEAERTTVEQSQVETLSDGLVSLLLEGQPGRLEAVIRALRNRGVFRSLAEPNLIVLDGEEATFLAGGEFPFPVLQSAGGPGSNAITLTWKEFGVRLTFRPEITDSGTIRLRVAPEVSSLDFANGLRLSGFQIPVVLTRRVETEVELRPGQHLSIAGLMDQSIRRNDTRIPILGDIPILGWLFRTLDRRQDQTELVVIVTPHLVTPTGTPPPLPDGLDIPPGPRRPDGGRKPGGLDESPTLSPSGAPSRSHDGKHHLRGPRLPR